MVSGVHRVKWYVSGGWWEWSVVDDNDPMRVVVNDKSRVRVLAKLLKLLVIVATAPAYGVRRTSGAM